MLHVCHAGQAIGKLRNVRRAAGCLEVSGAAQIFDNRHQIDALLQFAQADHALENVAVLRKEEVLGAHALDRGVQGMVIQENCAQDASFGFQIVGQRAFERGVAGHVFRFSFA